MKVKMIIDLCEAGRFKAVMKSLKKFKGKIPKLSKGDMKKLIKKKLKIGENMNENWERIDQGWVYGEEDDGIFVSWSGDGYNYYDGGDYPAGEITIEDAKEYAEMSGTPTDDDEELKSLALDMAKEAALGL